MKRPPRGTLSMKRPAKSHVRCSSTRSPDFRLVVPRASRAWDPTPRRARAGAPSSLWGYTISDKARKSTFPERTERAWRRAAQRVPITRPRFLRYDDLLHDRRRVALRSRGKLPTGRGSVFRGDLCEAAEAQNGDSGAGSMVKLHTLPMIPEIARIGVCGIPSEGQNGQSLSA